MSLDTTEPFELSFRAPSRQSRHICPDEMSKTRSGAAFLEEVRIGLLRQPIPA